MEAFNFMEREWWTYDDLLENLSAYYDKWYKLSSPKTPFSYNDTVN